MTAKEYTGNLGILLREISEVRVPRGKPVFGDEERQHYFNVKWWQPLRTLDPDFDHVPAPQMVSVRDLGEEIATDLYAVRRLSQEALKSDPSQSPILLSSGFASFDPATISICKGDWTEPNAIYHEDLFGIEPYITTYVGGHRVCLKNVSKRKVEVLEFNTTSATVLFPDGSIEEFRTGGSVHLFDSITAKNCGYQKEGSISKRGFIAEKITPIIEREFGLMQDLDYHVKRLRGHFGVGEVIERVRRTSEARLAHYEEDEMAGIF